MTGYTKGPWTLSENRAGHAIVCASGRTVAAAHLLGTIHPREEVKANARLISAAPDMYEALSEMVDLMEDVISGDYKPDSFTCQPARDALAKAEGKA